MPGNSTMLRTGTMLSTSSGSGASLVRDDASGLWSGLAGTGSAASA